MKLMLELSKIRTGTILLFALLIGLSSCTTGCGTAANSGADNAGTATNQSEAYKEGFANGKQYIEDGYGSDARIIGFALASMTDQERVNGFCDALGIERHDVDE